MRIGITGASGFIGAELTEHLAKSGFNVVRMQRKEPEKKIAGTEYFHFDLLQPLLPEGEKLDALVHCAVITQSRENPDAFQRNIDATLKLRDHCRENNIHFIFLSTMSAHAEAISVYGRHKFELEKQLDEKRETILKAGLVIGNSGGLFSNIRKTIEKSSFIPLVSGGVQPIQTIAVQELCGIIEKVITEKIKGKYVVASPQVITLKELYSIIANAAGKSIKFISVPYSLLYFILWTVGFLRIPLAVSTENLSGLKQLRSFDTSEDLKRLGIELSNTATAINKIFSGKNV